MDPHPIEQNIQALNDGEHNLKLHAPCSIIRCVPCLVQCIGTAIQGSFWGDSTGCDVMGFYSAFATYSSQMATLLIAYLTYRIMFSTVPKWEYVALVGLAIFVLSGLISMLPLIGVASYVKYDGFCYIDYRDVTHWSKIEFFGARQAFEDPPPHFEGAGCEKAGCKGTQTTKTQFAASVCTKTSHFS